MPYLGNESFREEEQNLFLAMKMQGQGFPVRRLFRVYYDSVNTVPATSVYARVLGTGQQALYFPPSSSGHISWTVVANVNGTLGTLTELGSYSVNSSGVITYTGGAIGTNVNSATYTPTQGGTVTSALELVVGGLTVGHTHSAYIIAEIFPHSGIEDYVGYRAPGTATLTAIEGSL